MQCNVVWSGVLCCVPCLCQGGQLSTSCKQYNSDSAVAILLKIVQPAYMTHRHANEQVASPCLKLLFDMIEESVDNIIADHG